MPSIPIYPPAEGRASRGTEAVLPQILQTPSGLAIVEIQGTVNTPAASSQQNESQADSSSIGKIVFPYYDEAKSADDTSWHKRVYMYVGKHQRLTGEVKKLSQPIAVLRRRTKVDQLSDGDELEVAEIVYYKLLFAHRPEPVGAGGGEA